jgi:cytochrome P450
LPEIYAEPDLFDPDRFAPPREEDTKHQYSLIGFGGGAHSCIGVEFAKMEMKLILGILLDNYGSATKWGEISRAADGGDCTEARCKVNAIQAMTIGCWEMKL